jgi:2-keto-4-pentenoate hydratase/2-oxohepta-3-ene-1,7-dioic acid hydratase in catechol pathway
MKIICAGLNYKQHVQEMNWPFPVEPVLFMKPDSAIVKNNKPFFLPDFSSDINYEVEVVVKISKLGKGIEERYAYRYFDEITMGIDLTARDIQSRMKKQGLPWEISKGFDGAAPLGKFVPVSSVKDVNNLDFRLEINGTVVQKSNTSDLIFSIGRLIEHASKFFTLKTGDLIFTGTPSGVGSLKKDDHLVAFMEDKPMLDFFIR